VKLHRIHRPGIGKSAGFTLLEVLLAFVIFALSFSVVLEILAGSMRGTIRARSYSEAALLAQSLVDMVGLDIPLVEGIVDGEAPGGYTWVLSISPYEPQDANDRVLELAELSGTVLFRVDLDLEWGQDRRPQHTRFSTVRSILESRRR
jgi:general secretion pathway protein I